MKLRWLVLGLLVALLLVPALLVSTARALDLAGGTWVRLTAFTPHAAVLYLGAALLLVLAWVRGRGGIAVRVLAVLSLVAVGVHLYWASGPFVGAGAAEAAAGGRLNVMTSNLRFGGADTARVVELAVTRDVDVLVLEEVTPQALAGLRRAGLARVFPHHAGAPVARTPAGTMVFSRTRLARVHGLRTAFGSYSLDVRLGGGTVHVLALHTHAPVGDALGWLADQLVVRRAAAGMSGPTVIVGDLNATMDHEPMRELVGRGYADAATQAASGWQPTWPSAGMVSPLGVDIPPMVAIDHVMVRGCARRAPRRTAWTAPTIGPCSPRSPVEGRGMAPRAFSRLRGLIPSSWTATTSRVAV